MPGFPDRLLFRLPGSSWGRGRAGPSALRIKLADGWWFQPQLIFRAATLQLKAEDSGFGSPGGVLSTGFHGSLRLGSRVHRTGST